MSHIYLSLGSNLSDRYANLRAAVERINETMPVTAISPVYSTEPWGDAEQPSFLNICIAAVTDRPPTDVLAELKRIESDLGRVPSYRWGPRAIDIDLLFYDQLVLGKEGLEIPHPGIADRAFVLAPLADIVPNFIHPVTGQTVAEMLELVDAAGVERLFEMPFPERLGEKA